MQSQSVFSVIDLLLTVAYIDGRLHEGEQAMIRRYAKKLAGHVADPSAPDTLVDWQARFDEAYAKFETEIAGIVAEVTSSEDDRYVSTRLKVRAVALFRSFTPADQEVALELLSVVMHADGEVDEVERELHDELVAYFRAAPTLVPAPGPPPADQLVIEPPLTLEPKAFGHPLLDQLEHRYATDPAQLHAQLGSDYHLCFEAITAWERQRARGNGRLLGVTDVGQLAAGTRWLDGHVHILRPDRPTELIVLGDLHGCYSCLKGALLQTDFIERVLRHQADPATHPDVKLVLLGDFIDRGLFSFEGVLRAALKLFVTFPDHVYLLRGNHEYLVRREASVVSAVNPAEAVPGLAAIAPVDVLEAYRHLFDHMPTSLLFDRTLFVHGGIPREDTIAGYGDLSNLDDAVVRFEMMWSDPVDTDRVPVELQRESPRFNFGREQFREFMERVGCHTLIRGHEQTDDGFHTVFDGAQRLHTLFSAGGTDNDDLPPDARYRKVTPKGLIVRAEPGALVGTPFDIEYRAFTAPANNGLYR
ncbi:MAG: metallophosphoesterase [Kofleriaceae bacterium]